MHPFWQPLKKRGFFLVTLSLLGLLSGCDYLGIEPNSKMMERKDAEGKAVGSACRHAGRAIEDCYVYNPNYPRAAIFNGWREMNDYMAEKKLEEIKPEVVPAVAATAQQEKGKDKLKDKRSSERFEFKRSGSVIDELDKPSISAVLRANMEKNATLHGKKEIRLEVGNEKSKP